MNILNLVWRNYKERCKAEMVERFGLEGTDSSDRRWFSNRMTGCKAVLESLTEPEKQKLLQEKAKMQTSGNPPDVQNRYVLMLHVVPRHECMPAAI